MGMGMNDMSAMNMMQYGGGYGNGWNGMGSGYGNFNGSNQMGGYNQSGAYPEMMNQFPKNNFPNQNQNRFHANQGEAHPQRDRNGSRGSFGPTLQNAHSRPGSRSGPAQNVRRFHHHLPLTRSSSVSRPSISATDKCFLQQRDGQSPDGTANTAPEANASADNTETGKESADNVTDTQAVQQVGASGEPSNEMGESTDHVENGTVEAQQGDGLKPIQTFDSGDADMPHHNQAMLGNGMQGNMSYQAGMMNQFPNQPMNASFNPSMNMNMGYDQHNNFGSRGGFNNGAYGAARVLTGQATEPVGVGVIGAPTGPRAMREGRPNTGFSSRMNSGRIPQAPKSVVSASNDAAPGSPQRRVRS